MIVGALGHGGYSILTDDAHLLIDPVVDNGIMAGIAEVFPRRQILLDAMAQADAMLITHFHAGHLEVPSLAKLPRELAVLHPADPTITFVLDRLGFTNRYVVAPGQIMRMGATELVFTGCGLPIPYVGCIVHANGASCWHMGDRGDTMNREEIARLAVEVGGIDVLICSHPSDNHEFLLHGNMDGGAHDGEDHRTWLERSLDTILAVSPRCFVPGTSSFRYRGRAAWLNRYLVPMRPEEFITCAREVAPRMAGYAMTPGDTISIDDGVPLYASGTLPFVTPETCEDDRSLDTTQPFPELEDLDPDGLGADTLFRRVETFLLGPLLAWCESPPGDHRRLLAEYRSLGLRTLITAVLPGGRETSWLLTFGPQTTEVEPSHVRCPPAHDLLRVRIAASTLDRWLRDKIPYFVAAVDCRRGGRVYAYAAAGGRAVVRFVEGRDPLSVMLLADRQRLHNWLEGEIQRWR